tara:strand:+ start:1135 stop:1476 length:342 start_codon:yes stop_codon:yes gene_type:complete
MKFKEKTKVKFFGGLVLATIFGGLYLMGSSKPTIYETKEKTVIRQAGKVKLFGEDLDKDGILDKCFYGYGIRGGGGWLFDCDSPPSRYKEQLTKMVDDLQSSYDSWRDKNEPR